MSRKNKRVDAAEDLATAAVDKVAPLIQSAADQVAPLAQAAADRLAPLAHSAAEAVSPYAHSAAEAVSPYAHQVADKVAPYAHQAADALEPYATSARKHGAQLAHDVSHSAAEKVGPKLDDAREKVQDKLQKDVLPALADRLADAAQGVASSPAAIEAQKRSKAAAAALRGELIMPEDEPKKKRWLLRIGVVTALGGLVFFLVKRVLGGQDSDWQSAKPTPYSSSTASGSADGEQPGVASDPTAPGSDDRPGPGASVVADHDSVYEIAPDAKDVAAQQAAEQAAQHEAKHADTEPAGAAGESDQDPGRADYGEHAFVGAEPPEGFTIKGNGQSKKYHLPESPSYGRTKAEVWFDSEDAAQAAGFAKATR